MEHRSGLIVRTAVTPGDGYGERDAALVMIETVPGPHRITVAADKGYDTRDFVAGLRAMAATSHIAQPHHEAAERHRRTNHPAPGLCDQSTEEEAGRARLRLDEDHGRAPQTAPSRRAVVQWIFAFTAAAYNIVRMRRLLTPATV
jgi:hypothetical protein